MLTLGIACGLIAAVLHAGAYLLSRRYVVTCHRPVFALMVTSHTLMGLVCGVGLLPMLGETWPPVSDYAWEVFATAGTYYIGQIGLLVAMRKSDASRVGALLGLKVIFVAFLAMFFLEQHITPLQWLAIGLAVASAFTLNAAGGSLPTTSILGVMTACVLFAVSDIYIKKLIAGLQPLGEVRAPIAAALLCYGFCGVLSLPLLAVVGIGQRKEWKAAAPYAGAWLSGILFMFACYAYAGVVLAVMILSLRGLFAIGLGVLVARAGHLHLERHVPRNVLIRRILAAIMMTLALVLYIAQKRAM